LKTGDRIVGVGQGPGGPIEDVVEMKLSDVVKKIRGPRGTVVRLEVVSPRSKERKIIQITREKIELKDREARAKVFPDGKKPNGRPYQIGVIQLPSFYMDMEGARQGLRNFKSTARDVRRILENFNRDGVDALVLDLRQNGGGSLQEAIGLTSLFLGPGPIVQVKDSDGRVTPLSDPEGTMLWRGPMVVLVSKYSASASEILAGAIQDYGRGLIVGDHSTHGKGTVQSLTDLGGKIFTIYGPKLGSLKITMQQFYRPKGDSTQRQGVLADIELPSLSGHFEGISEADLDYAIPFDRVPAQPIRSYNLVNKEIVDRLNQLSLERRGMSREFDQLQKRIARYDEQKKRKRITLNEQKYLAERAEWNAEKEEEKRLEEMAEGRTTDIKRDYYLDEVLAITEDYLHLLARSGGPAPQAVQAAKAAPSEN
jgi:carboxyl-terminal processing protease